jgi:hypothetical protein
LKGSYRNLLESLGGGVAKVERELDRAHDRDDEEHQVGDEEEPDVAHD